MTPKPVRLERVARPAKRGTGLADALRTLKDSTDAQDSFWWEARGENTRRVILNEAKRLGMTVQTQAETYRRKPGFRVWKGTGANDSGS